MDFEVLLVKSDTLIYDISELVTPVNFNDNINVSGVCTFGMLLNGVRLEEGNGVRITCDGVRYFAGYIFKLGFSETGEAKVTAYDQLRYLKANDTFVFKNNETASQIVKTLCEAMELRMGVIEDTKYSLGTMTFDDKPMLDMIADCVTKTLIDKKQIYFLKDNAGKVEFRNIQNCLSDLVIAPDSLLYGYQYERDIDSDTYNQIKLVRDNKDSGQREIYMSKDSGNIKKWGTLQYYEKVDDDMTPAQVKEKADSLLFLKNRVGQKLSVDVLGEKTIRAGNMLFIDLPDAKVRKYLLCTAARHHFTNTAHTVKADLKLV